MFILWSYLFFCQLISSLFFLRMLDKISQASSLSPDFNPVGRKFEPKLGPIIFVEIGHEIISIYHSLPTADLIWTVVSY